MPVAKGPRILSKFRRAHKRLRGADKPVSFVKFVNTVLDPFKSPVTSSESITIDPQPVVTDQPGEDIVNAFAGGIMPDQRIFTVVADSFIDRDPIDTLGQRCDDFILSISGQNRGGIQYGNDVYTIERFFARPILGGIPARYVILARAQKKNES